MSCSMSIEQKLRKESIFQVQSVFNVMVCFDQRFAVKNSGLSCLALIFYLSNSNIKILNSTLFQQGAEILYILLAILRVTEPVSALTRALLYCCTLYNFSFSNFVSGKIALISF